MRRVILPLAAAMALACHDARRAPTLLVSVPAAARDVEVRVQATGALEPIDPVDIRSKTTGIVRRVPVDVGMNVGRGALLVQVDDRDVRNQYEEALADDVTAFAALGNARLSRTRYDSMYAKRVITVAAHDSSTASFASAHANAVGKRADLDVARQHLEEATIVSPIAGTIISKTVQQGQLIQSAIGVYGGGATLMTVADLGRVRMKVNIAEADMGNVRIGEKASIVVDAFPDRSFNGVVEKIEPQAIVDQGVTFFPIMVSIDNHERLLMPGMDGEVTILADRRSNVLAVPADAVRGASELSSVARLFGIKADSLNLQLRPELIPDPTSGSTGGHFVVVARPDSSYELRSIELGVTDLQWYEVKSGLAAGERVVPISEAALQRPAQPPVLRLAAAIRKPGFVAEPAGAPRK